MVKPTISFDAFSLIDIRAGTVKTISDVPGSEKLYRLDVYFGEEIGTKTILSGIKKSYSKAKLRNKTFLFVVNLEPRKMMGMESQGMILASENEVGTLVLMKVKIPPGSEMH